MKKSLLFSAALAASSLLVTQAHAAMLTMSDAVDAAYLSDGLTVDPGYSQGTTTGPITGTPGSIYEIPIYFQISNLQAGETGFGSLDVSVTSSGGVTLDNNVAPYAASTATYTSGKSQKAYYFANFAAAATIAPDFQNVVASIPGGVTSGAGATLGQSGPFLVGYIYADMGDSSGSVNIHVNAFNTNNSGTLVADATGQAVDAGTLQFVLAPEPASLSLLGIGAVGLVARRRRTA